MLSVIVPTLNSERGLTRALTALVVPAAEGVVSQVVVSDGGSGDRTLEIADGFGCDVVQGRRGRGVQLAAGAERARHPWLMFLHSDTVLEEGWHHDVVAFIERQEKRADERRFAASFRFALDDDGSGARLLENLVALRCALFALPYGDQGLVISARHYARVGGFRELPLMEDVDLVRRIGRRRLTIMRPRAITSAERYQRDGYVSRMGRNLCCLGLYYLRVPPRVIARLYGVSGQGLPAIALLPTLVIMAKAPVAGRVKTRLAREVGVAEALRFYRTTLERTLRRLGGDPRWRTLVAAAPDAAVAFPWPHGIQAFPQGPGDLGARMQRVMDRLPPGPVAIVGSDIPAASPGHVAVAFSQLAGRDAVFGPAEDGGYWLVGLRRRPRVPRIFQGVRWSSAHALADTLKNCRGLSVGFAPELPDVDTVENWREWRRREG